MKYNLCLILAAGYSSETLNILKELNIKIGFSHYMGDEKKLNNNLIYETPLEIPRQDHAKIMVMLQK